MNDEHGDPFVAKSLSVTFGIATFSAGMTTSWYGSYQLAHLIRKEDELVTPTDRESAEAKPLKTPPPDRTLPIVNGKEAVVHTSSNQFLKNSIFLIHFFGISGG